jgi:OmpA-OmpF porin, OOP family
MIGCGELEFGQSRGEFDTDALAAGLTAAGIGHTGITTDETDSAWKVYAGYRFNRHLAIEGGLVDLGEFTARTTVTSVDGLPVTPGTLIITAKTDIGFQLAGVGIWPIGPASVFGKLGVR